MTRARVLAICVLAFALACGRPTAEPECPPAPRTPPTPHWVGIEDELKFARYILAEPEKIEVEADDGHPIAVWTNKPFGEIRSPPVVLVHGRTWSSIPDFDLRTEAFSLSLINALAGEGFAVYAVDLRGYGATERDASGWLEPDRAAEDLAAVLAHVQAEHGDPPHLLGWSFGAMVAQLAVQRHPDAARSLTLYGFPRPPGHRVGEDADGPAQPPRQPTTREAARSDFITPGTLTEAEMAAFAEAAVSADPIRVDWRALHQFNVLDPAALTLPTLVIHGQRDPIARAAWQAELVAGLGAENRQWVVIPNADHAAHLEQPAAFERALLAFFASAG